MSESAISDRDDQKRVRSWLSDLAAPARSLIRGSVAWGVAAGALTVVQMSLLAWIIHQAVVESVNLRELTVPFLALLGVLVARAVCQGLQARYAAVSSRQIRNALRRLFTRRLHAAGPVVLGTESPATLAREWLDHVDALHGYYARFLPQMLLAGLVPLMILVVVFWLDWLAGVFLLLSAPLIPLFMALVGMGAEKLNQQHFRTISRLSGQFLDRIRGLTTLQLFDADDRAATVLEQRSDAYRRVTMKTLRVAFLSSAVLEFFSSVAIAAIAIYIGFGLLGYITFGPADSLTLFSGLLVLMLAPEFFQPLRLLAQHYHDRAAALGAGTELLDRLEGLPDRDSPKFGDRYRPDADAGIRVDRVCFGFGAGQQPVFSDLSLQLESGSVTALTGPSGGGKSTLLHLLAGFVTPDRGQVQVFGLNPGEMRFGWLGQQPFLVHGTWADNLRLTSPEASDVAIEAALRQLGLGGLIDERPEGINSPVSESGAGLSGGQGRRLSLARILVADYDLILMDEPTAGLDPDSEVHVIEALHKLAMRGKTLVFSSHQPALLTLADHILSVSGDGQVQDTTMGGGLHG
jgi:ATP-binding cassette subfamily C protein CydD